MNINGYFIYNGVDTRTLGVDVSRGVAGNILRRPAREYQVSQPPGRLGDIIQDNRHFPNVEITYHVMIPDNFDAVYRQLRGALLGATGYARLEDSWNTEEFYQAYVSAPLQPTVSANRRQGMLGVTFSRRPERWLKSGETPITPPTYNLHRIDILAQDYPYDYTCFPRMRLRYMEALPETGYYATSYQFVRLYTNKPHVMSQYDGLWFFKANYNPWSDYLTVNDELVIDFAEGKMENITQNTDISKIIDYRIVNGIQAPHSFGPDVISIVLEAIDPHFEFIDYTPRWYVI